MDLEHYELGGHCSMPGCNQKDFLPFKCDVCSRELCLRHRSYLNHKCEGEESKNYTSIACPICTKTIKFTKSENIDMVWEQHYFNGCSQEPEKDVTKKLCPICNTKIGLANVFHCKLCNREVCISHRSPEDHNCVSLSKKRQSQSNLTKNDNNKSNVKPNSSEASYSCPICGIQGFSLQLLNQHIDNKHME